MERRDGARDRTERGGFTWDEFTRETIWAKYWKENSWIYLEMGGTTSPDLPPGLFRSDNNCQLPMWCRTVSWPIFACCSSWRPLQDSRWRHLLLSSPSQRVCIWIFGLDSSTEHSVWRSICLLFEGIVFVFVFLSMAQVQQKILDALKVKKFLQSAIN